MLRTVRMEDNPSLGAFVRRRRSELGITQEQLAERLDTNQRWVSRLENDMKELPEPEMIARLAEALHCPEEDLLRAAGYLSEERAGTEELSDVAIYTNMMHQIDRLSIPPRLKAHMRQTVEFVRSLEERNHGQS